MSRASQRALARGAVALAFAVAAPPAAAGPAIPERCVFESPCVWVTPDVEPETAPRGTVLTFQGRGWRPGSRVEALYGAYCPPTSSACGDVGFTSRLRVGSSGRFTFRFRYGDREPGRPGPKAAGGGEVGFSGVGRGGRRVWNREAAAPPPPSTPAERLEAGRIDAAARALMGAIARARPRVQRAAAAYEREIGRCQPLIRISRPPRRDAVIWQVVDAAADAAIYGPAAPELEAYAARLERIAPRDPVLAEGVAAWAAAIRAARFVPRPTLCGELRRWREQGFARSAEPVSPFALGLDEEVEANPAIRLAGKRLRGLGIPRAGQDRFEGGVLGLVNFIGP